MTLRGNSIDIAIYDDITYEADMKAQQKYVVAGTKRARQLVHSHAAKIRASNHTDVGIKPKAGWKFITAVDGSISKVRA